MDSKKPNILSLLAEVLVALVLLVLSLAVLNYFNIFPLSKNFPFLSFLPSKTVANQQINNEPSGTQVAAGVKKGVFFSVVTPDKPLKITNASDTYEYKPVENSSILATGAVTIDVELAYDTQNPDTKESSGLMWTNDKPYDDKAHRALVIFRYPPAKSWVVEYRSEGESLYTTLVQEEQLKSFGKFRLNISEDGKSVNVIGQNTFTKIDLPNSLYESSNLMTMVSQVAPKSTLDVHSLYLDY